MQETETQRLVRSILNKNRNATHATRSRAGMNDLANIVLNMYRDIKRVTDAIAPQSAAELIRKHNEKSPDHPWYLLKTDPNGPDVIENCGDLNKDGVPDVVVMDSNNNPVFVNGYTTKRSNWPNDALYYSTLPTKEDRKQAKRDHGRQLLNESGEPILNSKGEPIYIYSKKDFLDEYKGIEYQSPNNTDDMSSVGNIISTNSQNLPGWYLAAADKYKYTEPKRLSAFKRYQTYIFKQLFSDACDRLEDIDHITLTGQQKMMLFAKLSSAYWTSNTNRIINPGNNLSAKDIAKLRKNNDIKQLFDNYVNDILTNLRNTPGYYDSYLDNVYNDLKRLTSTPQPIAPPPAADEE